MANKNLTFGILLPTRGVLLAQKDRPDLKPIFEMASAVEKAGYHSIWIGDSVTAKSRLEVISTLGALSAKTDKLKIGTSVVIPALRNPVLLAQAVATVDVLCQGRLIFGVGVQRGDKMFEEEFTACGVPFNQKAGRLDQVLKIMRLLWSQDNVTYPNKYYQIENVSLLPKTVQKPGVPIWIASNDVDPGLKRVALLGDAWMTNLPSIDVFKESWKKIESYAAEAGRDAKKIHRSLYLTVHVGSDGEKARKEGGEFLSAYYHKTFEAVAKQLVVKCGSTQEVADFIQAYADAGIETFVIRFAANDQMGHLQTFTESILPQFK
ncbi:MAG: LLM class flavin-dependent oxidoreductase [Candidatus Binatia bacterium]|jgi:alkanesulfonate monooxygenase SsuD/methylene tetrahydromethanopterin reductase-like flavin-dependent oxidoreductase (luciferase family)|nr:LLM class flavin-dependent oxidoreductase [Candidatus Binatia bacterium]